MGVSERRACKVLGQPRSTQRYEPVPAAYEEELTAAIVELASQYGRYGYRRIGALPRRRGWAVNHKRVERIWRQEGLKAPQKQPKRSRLWLNDGSCVRLRPQRPNHVWAYDFVFTRTHDGRSVRLLTRHRRVHAGVPGDQGGAEHQVCGRDRDAGRVDAEKGSSRTHPL